MKASEILAKICEVGISLPLKIRAMKPSELAAAYAVDLVLGDPEWFPHPVRAFGLMIQSGERCLRPLTVGPKTEFVAGTVLTGSVASAGWLLGRWKNAPCKCCSLGRLWRPALC